MTNLARNNKMAHLMRSPLLACLLLVVSLAACGGYTQATSVSANDSWSAKNLSLLCANNEQFRLKRSSQIQELIEELNIRGKEQVGFCSSKTVSAIRDLHELLEANKNNVCSLEATSRIKSYYDTHMAFEFAQSDEFRASGEHPIDEHRLPTALKEFFLGYGLQVSSLCKRNMISSLMYENEQLLNQRDHDLIEPWTNQDSLISQMMSDPRDYDDILLPRDINQVLMETRNDDNDEDIPELGNKLFMHVATGPVVKRMQAACNRRFKPIYEQLIMPILYLSNMGFNYKGEELERELKEMSLNKGLHQWYRIVYLCESLESVVIVENAKDNEKMENSDKRLVQIMSPEEAAKAVTENKQSPDADEEEFLRKMPQIVYEMPGGLRLGDEILNEQDENLIKLIQSFATHKTELDHIKARMIRKLTQFLIHKLKHGGLKVAFSALFSGIRGQEDEAESRPANANNQVIEALNSFVDGLYNPDQPVAGLKDYKATKVGKRYYQQFAMMGAKDYKNMGKQTLDKMKIKRGFWFILAISLFVLGATLLLSSLLGR